MKTIIIVFTMLLSILAGINTLNAAGIGVYGSGGVSMINWKYLQKNFGGTTDFIYGCGLVVDSAAAKNRLFNYRFSLGYEQYGSRNPSLFGADPNSAQAHKFDMSHTFGFGLVRSETVRFWIGPQIGASCLYSLNFPQDRFAIRPPYYYHGVYVEMYDLSEILYLPRWGNMLAIGVDVLLAIGVNVHVGDCATLFAEIGFGFMGTYYLNDNKEAGSGLGLKGKAGVLFRISDRYEPEGEKRSAPMARNAECMH